MLDQAAGLWRTEPSDIAAIVRSHPGPIILDFDETLYLGNSTEDFLAGARPKLVAKLLLRGLEACKPWKLTGGIPTRDVWRIGLILLFFPWTWLIWHRRAADLVKSQSNTTLMRSIVPRQDVIVATNGFGLIVGPLLVHMGLGDRIAIACRLRCGDRLAGKLALLAERIGQDQIRQALVVTDSLDDRPLLEACAGGCLVLWPQAQYREALTDVYLPFQYLVRVKRPKSRYIWHSILQEDFAFWVLASIALSAIPLLHVAGLLCFVVSFWAVYETGYVDNDRMAERFEADGKLSSAYAGHGVATPPIAPWIWAGLCALAGEALLAWPAPPRPGDLLAWAGVLVATCACFRLFNRIDKASRIWLFAPLQLARAAGIVAVTGIVPVGAAALAAHAVSLWIPYCLYRSVRHKTWPNLPVFAIRLLIFVVFAGLILAAEGTTRFDWSTAGALMAWNLFRARREVVSIVKQAHRIDRPLVRRPAPSPETAPTGVVPAQDRPEAGRFAQA